MVGSARFTPNACTRLFSPWELSEESCSHPRFGELRWMPSNHGPSNRPYEKARRVLPSESTSSIPVKCCLSGNRISTFPSAAGASCLANGPAYTREWVGPVNYAEKRAEGGQGRDLPDNSCGHRAASNLGPSVGSENYCQESKVREGDASGLAIIDTSFYKHISRSYALKEFGSYELTWLIYSGFPVCYLKLNGPNRKIKQLLSCQLSYLQ